MNSLLCGWCLGRASSSISRKICPLTFIWLFFEIGPSVVVSSSLQNSCISKDENLHFSLCHGTDQLQLSLSNLNDLLNQSSTNLILNITNPTNMSIQSNPVLQVR